MQKDRWQKIDFIFTQAVALPLGERSAFVEKACAGDADLQREIFDLLAADHAEDNPLDEEISALGLQVIETDELLIRKTAFSFYLIKKLLGRGGMGAVYLAEDLRLGRSVALKVLPSLLSANLEYVRRFRQEARTASVISHPNVAHIYEFGEEAGRHFLAMEFVDGKTLRALLIERQVDLYQAVDVALQIAEALEATHSRGIIHRDIKPENIIITGSGLVKVLDFGVAKLMDLTAADRFSISESASLIDTAPGTVMGTIGYISPEQLMGKAVDFRADIWSLGVVFYEMLTGRKPFDGKTARELGQAILKNDLVPFPLAGPTPKDTARIQKTLTRLLAKNAAERCRSAAALVAELKELKQDLDFNQQFFMQKISPDNRPSGDVRVTAATRNPSFFTRDHLRDLPRLSNKMLALIAAIAVVTFGIGIVARYLGSDETAFRLGTSPPEIAHLTRDGRIRDAAISRNGLLLAFVPIEAGRHSLWIRDLQTGTDRQILKPDANRYWGVRFLPDGQNLLFLTTLAGGSETSLHRISIWGGLPEKILSPIAEPPAIAPDGKNIAFLRNDPVNKRDVLLTAAINDPEPREIAARRYPNSFAPASTSWSPDGKLIAIGAGRDNNTENALLAYAPEGGSPIELTDWRWAAIGGMDWESDSEGLVFSAREPGSQTLKLWHLSTRNGRIEKLTDDAQAFEEVTLSYAGKKLVTTRTYEVSDIWAMSFRDGLRRLTAQGNDGADGLVVLPDGRIVFTKGEYEQSFIWRMNADGGERIKLAGNTGFLPAASRDGLFIAYVSTESGNRHVWLTGTDGAGNRRMTGGDGENYPVFTPDGKWIVYTVLGRDLNTIWKMPVGGGAPVQLTREGFAIKPQVSPDGRLLACTFRLSQNEPWQITILSFAGGPPIRTFDLPSARAQIIRWTPDSRGLYFINERNGVHNIWRMQIDGGQPRQVTHFSEDQILHYDITGDGAGLIISRGGRRRDIALIENYR